MSQRPILSVPEKEELLTAIDPKAASLAGLGLEAWPLDRRWTGQKLHATLVSRSTPRPYLTVSDYAEIARGYRSKDPTTAASYIREGRRLLAYFRHINKTHCIDHCFETLLALGWAAALTGHQAYVRLAERLIIDHFRHMPPYPRGQSMDDGLWNPLSSGRFLLYASAFLYMAPLAGYLEDEVIALMFLFGHRILAYLRRQDRYNFSNITLLAAGSSFCWTGLFPEFRAVAGTHADWREWLAKNATIIFRPDGGNYEQSPNYHSFSQHTLSYAWRFDRVNKKELTATVGRRLEKAAEFFSAIRLPSGDLPPVGDTGIHNRDLGLAITALTCNRPDLLHGIGRCPGVAWHVGARWVGADFSKVPTPKWRCRSFPHSGFYVMRSGWKKDATYGLFLCGPHGMFHGHFNLLSLFIWRDNKVLVGDPGTWASYDGSPNQIGLKTTPFHSTLSLGNLSYRPWEDGEPILARVKQWELQGAGVLCTAGSHAYDHLVGRPVVQRQFFYDGDRTWILIDRLMSGHKQAFCQNFVLPTLSIRRQPDLDRNLGVFITSGSAPRLMLVQAALDTIAHVYERAMPYCAEGKKGSHMGEGVARRLSFVKNISRGFFVTLLTLIDTGRLKPVNVKVTERTKGEFFVQARVGSNRYRLVAGSRLRLASE